MLSLILAPSVKSKITADIRGRNPIASVKAIAGEGLWEMVEEKQLELNAPETPLSTSATAQMPVHINGQRVMAHYDGGSEINVISAALAKRLGLAVTTKEKTIGMVGAGGQRSRFVGELQCEVSFGEIATASTLYVLDVFNISYDLLLGKPYGRAVRMVESTNFDGTTDLLAVSTDGKSRVHYKFDPAEGKNSNFIMVDLKENDPIDLSRVNRVMVERFSLKTKYKPVSKKRWPIGKPLEDGSIPYQWKNSLGEYKKEPASFTMGLK